MPKRKKSKTTRKTAQKPIKAPKPTLTTSEAEELEPGIAVPTGKAIPEKPSEKPAEKPIKTHELELLSQELIEGEIIETLHVKDIPAVGCIVRYIHRKQGNAISSGMFFVPDVAPIKGELRRSLV